jgi:galactokinase
MEANTQDSTVAARLLNSAERQGLDIKRGKIRRTSSRFCLGVEHGDYNGTELFGVGTDRFIWLAYHPNELGRIRIFSENFPDDGVIDFVPGQVPEPRSSTIADTWARFAYGVDYVLRRNGYALEQGLDMVLYGNIPGGGMSRSASLCLNLILSLLDANKIDISDQFEIVNLAQAVENDYIGSPCGQLDQIMILFAKAGMGTHYNPNTQTINYAPLGAGAADFRIVVMDTGTLRPGLEKSTYKIRRAECEELVAILSKDGYELSCLADIQAEDLYKQILQRYQEDYPTLCSRLSYIYSAQQRFYKMLTSWKAGDIETVGDIFRADGLGLRDDYQISGPELESMCDIVRTVDGVLGERMLGGGDKGAAGALALANCIDDLRLAVETAYPRSHVDFSHKYAVHTCKIVDGVSELNGLLQG